MLAEIIFLGVLGLVLIILEVFLPGMVMGILGAVALTVSAVLTFQEYGPGTGLLVLVLYAVLWVTLFVLWFKFFHRTFIGKRMMLASEIRSQEKVPVELVGQEGVAKTDLHPSGKAVVAGATLDVVADTGAIDRGARVIVHSVDGFRIVVRALS